MAGGRISLVQRGSKDRLIIKFIIPSIFWYANILKQVGLPLLKNQECQNLLRENTRLGPFFELDESFLCAGGQKDVDTCKGDGGSPLTCEQPDGSWVQV